MFAAREEQSVVVGTASRAVLSASPCCRVPGVKWSRDSFPPCFRAPSVYATTCAPSRRRGGGVFGGCSHARVCACVHACVWRACVRVACGNRSREDKAGEKGSRAGVELVRSLPGIESCFSGVLRTTSSSLRSLFESTIFSGRKKAGVW